MDGTILVMDADKTQKNQLRQSVERLREVNANMLGIVANRLSPKMDGYSSYYHYYYYRRNGNGGYGGYGGYGYPSSGSSGKKGKGVSGAIKRIVRSSPSTKSVNADRTPPAPPTLLTAAPLIIGMESVAKSVAMEHASMPETKLEPVVAAPEVVLQPPVETMAKEVTAATMVTEVAASGGNGTHGGAKRSFRSPNKNGSRAKTALPFEPELYDIHPMKAPENSGDSTSVVDADELADLTESSQLVEIPVNLAMGPGEKINDTDQSEEPNISAPNPAIVEDTNALVMVDAGIQPEILMSVEAESRKKQSIAAPMESLEVAAEVKAHSNPTNNSNQAADPWESPGPAFPEIVKKVDLPSEPETGTAGKEEDAFLGEQLFTPVSVTPAILTTLDQENIVKSRDKKKKKKKHDKNN